MPLPIDALTTQFETLLHGLERERENQRQSMTLQELKSKGEAIRAFAEQLDAIEMGTKCAEIPRKLKTAASDLICIAGGGMQDPPPPSARSRRGGRTEPTKPVQTPSIAQQERLLTYAMELLQALETQMDQALGGEYQERVTHLQKLRDVYIERMRKSFAQERIRYTGQAERRLVRDPPSPDLLKGGNYERIEATLFGIDDFADIVLKNADQQRVELRHDMQDWRQMCINEWNCPPLEKGPAPRLMWDFSGMAINAHQKLIKDMDKQMRMAKKLNTPTPQLREQLSKLFRIAAEHLYKEIVVDLTAAGEYYYSECVRLLNHNVIGVLFDPQRAEEVRTGISALRTRLTAPPAEVQVQDLVSLLVSAPSAPPVEDPAVS